MAFLLCAAIVLLFINWKNALKVILIYLSIHVFFFSSFFRTFLCFVQTKVSWYISNDYFSVFQGGECQCQAGRGCSNAEDGPVFCPRPGLPHRWVPGHPLRHVRPAADLWWSGGRNEKILPSVRRQIVSEVLFLWFCWRFAVDSYEPSHKNYLCWWFHILCSWKCHNTLWRRDLADRTMIIFWIHYKLFTCQCQKWCIAVSWFDC